MRLQRGRLLDAGGLTGETWCREHAALIDEWLTGLFAAATDGCDTGVALVAIGGYGRRELSPASDIDVALLHSPGVDVGPIADRMWYPVWDEGLHLGHQVFTVSQALGLARDDLTTATALLTARHLAGDAGLSEELRVDAAATWARRSKRWLTELGASVTYRHQKVGEVAFALEPDLKEGRGGMRDVHALGWARVAGDDLSEEDRPHLDDAYGVLLAARVELQRLTGSASNVLTLQEQDAVASALGDEDADALMGRVASAARDIAWVSDDAWRRIRNGLRGPLGRAGRRKQPIGAGLELRGGEVYVDPSEPLTAATCLAAAASAARHGAVLARSTLTRAADETASLDAPWPEAARASFAALLLAGRPAIDVIEGLDQVGVWCRILPEWSSVRSRPQRNAYHRFTVDRHLLEAAANAARLAGSVERSDLLVVAALLHDIGKGTPGDHVEIGVDLAGVICTRMGWAAADVAIVVALVEHHLLLADVATTRDIDDPTTIERVVASVGDVAQLRLLAALTEADSQATGPAAWSAWKAALVAQLVERVEEAFAGVDAPSPMRFPRQDQLERLASGGRHVEVGPGHLLVMCDDRPGIFSRVAGVLSLHGIGILAAAAHSTEDGRALSELRLAPQQPTVDWAAIRRDVELALDGRLALSARLADRAHTYRRRLRPAIGVPPPSVKIDNQASTRDTVIDVTAPDGVGVLYRITRALAELDLDIRAARIETRGAEVIDSFYVRDPAGRKVTDPAAHTEIRRAVIHSIGAL